MNRIRVLLAEDHSGFCEALKNLIELDSSIEIVGIALTGDQVLQCVGEIQPDVICMDIWLPRMNGIEVTEQLVKALPGTRIIGLSAHDEIDTIAEFLRAGAMGFVDKLNAAEELHRAIHAVYSNSTYLSKDFYHLSEHLMAPTLA